MSDSELLYKMHEVMYPIVNEITRCNMEQLINRPHVSGGRTAPLPNARGVMFEQFIKERGLTHLQMQRLWGYDRNSIKNAIKTQQELRDVNDALAISIYDNFMKIWSQLHY